MNTIPIHSERFKELRAALKLSQTAFGKHLGVSRDVISNLEGDRAKPREHFLKHMYEIYAINETWFLTGQGDMFLPREHSPIQLEALSIFNQLDVQLQKKALNKMQELLDSQNK